MSARLSTRHLAEVKSNTISGTTVALIVLGALLVVAAGVVIYVRRRHRPAVAREPAHAAPTSAPQVTDVQRPPAKRTTVFLSYRRQDSADVSGRIYDRLAQAFGQDRVFKDVDSIPLGVDFRDHLQQMVGRCDVLLAVIGDHWLDAETTSGTSRLDDPKDFVRIELEGALQRGIPVIPVLVRGASVPREEELPSTLGALTYRSGIAVRADPDFHRDMDRLVEGVQRCVTADELP